MKCAVKQVLYDRNIDHAQKVLDEISQNFLKVIDSSACGTLYSLFGFRKTRLERYLIVTAASIADDLDYYQAFAKDRPEYRTMFRERADALQTKRQNNDALETAYSAALQYLDRINYDFAANEAKWAYKDKFCVGSRPGIKALHDARMNSVRQHTLYYQVCVTAGLIHLHDEYGFGAERLERVHRGIRQGVNRFIELWTGVKDAETRRYIRSLTDRMTKEYGISVVWWEPRRQSEAEPPRELDGLAWSPEDIKTTKTERRILNNGKSEF